MSLPCIIEVHIEFEDLIKVNGLRFSLAHIS